jgi:hypothetical protein
MTPEEQAKILPLEKTAYRNMTRKQLYVEILLLCDKMEQRHKIIKALLEMLVEQAIRKESEQK